MAHYSREYSGLKDILLNIFRRKCSLLDLPEEKNYSAVRHGDLTGKQGKSVQYGINDFCLCRPGLHVPDISDSSRTVHIFDQVVTYWQQAA